MVVTLSSSFINDVIMKCYLIYVLITIFIFIASIMFYCYYEDYAFIDSLLFVLVTMTSVGEFVRLKDNGDDVGVDDADDVVVDDNVDHDGDDDDNNNDVVVDDDNDFVVGDVDANVDVDYDNDDNEVVVVDDDYDD